MSLKCAYVALRGTINHFSMGMALIGLYLVTPYGWGQNHHQLHGHDLNFAEPAILPYADSASGRENYRQGGASINSARLYDFYARQADFYMKGEPMPDVIPAYPGLDGGHYGHWGAKPHMDHSDNVWNSMNTGTVVGGIIDFDEYSVTKGVSVYLGGSAKTSCVFDPETLSYREVWNGGHIRFPTLRWGLMGTFQPRGEPIPYFGDLLTWSNVSPENQKQESAYKGYYRHEDRVAFHYQVKDADILDQPFSYEGGGRNNFGRTIEIGPHSKSIQLNLGPTFSSPKISHKKLAGVTVASFFSKEKDLEVLIAIESEERLFRFESGANGKALIHFEPTNSSYRIRAYIRNISDKDKETDPFLDGPNIETLNYFLEGGPSQWPIELSLKGNRGPSDSAYAIDNLPVPLGNPYLSPMFLTGLAFQKNGDAFVTTFFGDVWRVTGISESLNRVTWKRVAAGLHQPLGIEIFNDQIFVIGRDQITRLSDLNDDGEFDAYHCFNNKFETSKGSHDYYTGLQADPLGNLYFAGRDKGVYRVSNDGQKIESLASGIRNPNGLSVTPHGRIYTAPQEGQWTPSSMIIDVSHGGFFGYLKHQDERDIDLPLAYVPRGIDNSTGGQTFVNSHSFGPLNEKLISFSYGYGTHYIVLRDERTDGKPNGAIVPLKGEFLSGIHRGRVNPQDGQLYTVGSRGWGTYAQYDGAFHKIRYTQEQFMDPVGFKVFTNGIRIDFDSTLDKSTVNSLDHYFAQQWNYRYSMGYGSPEYSVKHPDQFGHDRVFINSAHLTNDNKSIFIEIPELEPVMQLHLRLHLEFSNGSQHRTQLFCTIADLGSPFKDAPGLLPVIEGKSHILEPIVVERVRTPTKDIAVESGLPGRPVYLSAQAGLKFSKSSISVKAGERITLTLNNEDQMPHNWILADQGYYQEIGELSDRMLGDPSALEKNYVPDSSHVLASIGIVNPEEDSSVTFNVPSAPGSYVYLCSYPGHWRTMRGTLFVY